MDSNDKKTQLTRKVSAESFLRTFPAPQRPAGAEEESEFRTVPQKNSKPAEADKRWRVVLSSVEKPDTLMKLEVIGDVVIGCSDEADPADIDVNMAVWQGEERGVSRRHVMLRPAREKLFLLDLGSTNATHLNGGLLTTSSVQTLSQGDLITLGRLHLRVKQIEKVQVAAGNEQRAAGEKP
jgi:hypothetical protein